MYLKMEIRNIYNTNYLKTEAIKGLKLPAKCKRQFQVRCLASFSAPIKFAKKSSELKKNKDERTILNFEMII